MRFEGTRFQLSFMRISKRIFPTSFCFPSLVFLGEAVNLLLRGENRLNNAKTRHEKFIVSMPRPLQVDEGGEGGYIFPTGKSARLS